MSRKAGNPDSVPRAAGAALGEFVRDLARARASLTQVHDGVRGRWDVRGERWVRLTVHRFERAAAERRDALMNAEADAFVRGHAPKARTGGAA
jgi:hypothetical protein